MKKHISTIIFVLVFLVGLAVMLYPTVSDYVNSKHQTRAIASYQDTVSDMDEKEYEKLLAEAEAYNKLLAETPEAFYKPELLKDYEDILDVTGTGVMGVISIPKINVNLPIYHGTSDGVLQEAAGHLQGTSFPVGGKSTHSVICGHRGLPSATLFTHLDRLEEGDTFTITVLNRTITYKVDLISIVDPDEVDKLQITDGKDYCTLQTCTPYGINTQRLLVRGVRVANAEEDPDWDALITADAYKVEPIVIAPLVAVPILLLLVIGVFVLKKKR